MSGNYRDKVVIRKRMTIVLLGLFLLLFVLCFRLFYVMVINGNYLGEKAKNQWTSEVKLSAKRGRILDRNGNELAVSANVYRVDLDLNAIRQYNKKTSRTMEDISKGLAEAIGMDQQKVLGILIKTLPNGEPMGSANLARRVEKAEADKVIAFKDQGKIQGIMISPDTKRYYPNNNFLAHVLGTTNVDGEGLTGAELIYNEYLAGVPGMRITELDRNSGEMPSIISEYTKPIPGKDLYLTIDEKIQYFAEKAADQALKDNKAKAVTVIVMNPKNGEVLGLVNKPDFNPNDPRGGAATNDELQKIWRNRAVNDTYEPGSIFKIVTAIAAMEEGLIKDNDSFSCGGRITIGGKNIKCWRTQGHGTQNFPDIIKNSCNMGFIELGRRLGPEKLNKYIDMFGLGKVSGIDLPGEAKGIIKKTKDITEVDLATIAFGQTNTVNPIQFLSAVNAVANNGVWNKPHIMKEISHVDENNEVKVDKKYDDYGTKRLVNEENTKALRAYLERVVTEGSGKSAFIEGYHVAGKTGTAQKPGAHGYEQGKYITSFVCMAPADDPQITLLISVDEPSNGVYYASQTAAPPAKQLLSDIFNYMTFKVDASSEQVAQSLLRDVMVPEIRGMNKDAAVKALKALNLDANIEGNDGNIKDINPKPGVMVKEGSKIVLYTTSSSNYNKEVTVPDLRGYTKEKAAEILNSLGLKANFSGEGMVSSQSIDPKVIVGKGTVVSLTLDATGAD